jgi:Predicted transcription factor, homolog of eukaryotic MBF1
MNMKEKTVMAQRIRELRKSKNLTQARLAQLTGLKETAIRSYENSLREPNSKAMAALEEYFNVSGAFLRGETDVRDFLPNNERKQLTTAQTADELSDLLKKIQTTIKDISDEELEYTDGLLAELSQALNIQDLNKRAAALRLLHTTAHISNNFFSSYNHFTDKLSKEESANKALPLTVEKYNEALEQIKNLLEKI